MKKLILGLLLVLIPLTGSRGDDLSTLLMKATFMISDGKSLGTCFIIGRPVFMIEKNRAYGGGIHMGVTQFIAGLVSEERNLTFATQTPYEARVEQHPLKLGVIIHASLIREAINMLPEQKGAQPKK